MIAARDCLLTTSGQIPNTALDCDRCGFGPCEVAAEAYRRVDATERTDATPGDAAGPESDADGRVVRFPTKPATKLSCNGVGRDAEHNKAVIVYFNRPLTDGELRFFGDVCSRSAPLMDGVTP